MGLLNLVGRISLDGGPFKQTLQGLKKEASSFGSVLSGQLSGLVGAGAMIGLAKSAIEAADKIDEVAERLGVSTLEAQQFALAAKLGGTEIDFFATKFEKLRDALRAGAAKGENPLAVFGISATTDPAVAMNALSDLIIDVGLSAEQSTAFVELMGKGSGKLINVLGDLRNAKGGTLFFSDDDIRNLKTADDLLTKFGNTARVAFAKLIDPKLGPLTQILGAMGINAFGVLDKPAQRKAPVNEAPMLAGAAAKEEAAKIHMAVQERLLKINKEIAAVEEKNRIAGFNDDEMRVDLALRREEIFKRIARTEEERAQKELDLRLNEQAILGVSKVSAKVSNPLKDSLTSVGNFLGANPNSGQMKEFSEMNRKLDAIVRNTARTGGSIFPQ
jgi:hypothetical protein